MEDGELTENGTVGFAIGNVIYNDAVIANYILDVHPDQVQRIMGGIFRFSNGNDDYAWNEREVTEEQAFVLYESILADLAALEDTKPASLDEVPDFGYGSVEAELSLVYTDLTGETRDMYINLGSYMTRTMETLYNCGVLTAEDALVGWNGDRGDYDQYSYTVTTEVG